MKCGVIVCWLFSQDAPDEAPNARTSGNELMQWPSTLIPGRLLRRYKRFLADVTLQDGRQVVAHCPNTGAMTGCAEPGSRVWLAHHDSTTRKLAYSWELVEDADGQRICVHSARANALVAEALEQGRLPGLDDYPYRRREWPLADGGRLDFALARRDGEWECFMEVKAVTLHCGGGRGQFPDTVSARATRHVEALRGLLRSGHRAALCFAVLHEGIRQVSPAAQIDPVYARSLAQAVEEGLELRALAMECSDEGISLMRELPFSL